MLGFSSERGEIKGIILNQQSGYENQNIEMNGMFI